MTIFDMLEQSGILTLLGMGVVFSFLLIMVIFITTVGKIINASNLNNNAAPAVSAVQKTGDDAAVTAAISAAVNEYRKNK
ncbi:MAG: OadG family protein [Treponema sp.]|jgi:oxaloacetate decarboxylase gamma subunit|nr:OadG family protein [Treponema sp.]